MIFPHGGCIFAVYEKDVLPPGFSKNELLNAFKKAERPLSITDLRSLVDSWKSHKNEVKALLREMVREGSLIRLKDNRFGIPNEMNLEVGTLWCTRSGNGFVTSDKEGGNDIFVPSRFIKDAIHGDKVVVRIEHLARGRRESRVVKVTERKTKNVTGFVQQHKNLFLLVPDDERISAHFIVEPGKKTIELNHGDLVAARVTGFPDGGDPGCKIVKVFRALDDAKKISQFIAYKQNLSPRFPRTVENEAKQTQLDIVERKRIDLRATGHVTIDGEFAKDFDGSKLAAEKRQTVYHLGGEEELIRIAHPILEPISSAILHIGPLGSASSLKLAMNLNIAGIAQTLCESLMLCRRARIRDDIYFAALARNAARSGVSDLKEPKLRGHDYSPQFSLKHMAKDLRLALETAAELSLPLEQTPISKASTIRGCPPGWRTMISLGWQDFWTKDQKIRLLIPRYN